MNVSVSSLVRAARAEPLVLLAFSAFAGAVFGFAQIADELSESETRPFDVAILGALHPYADKARALGPWWLGRVALDLTSLGSTAVLLLLALIVAGFLALRRRWIECAGLAAALAGGLALSEGLKGVFERERPPAIYRTFDVLNSSFPSGHALLSAVLYPTLAAMLAGTLKDRGLRLYVLAVGGALTLIVGLTRIYLAAHWSTDVLAGWCAGAAWAALCWLAERAAQARFTPSRETPVPRG